VAHDRGLEGIRASVQEPIANVVRRALGRGSLRPVVLSIDL
jgi:hypothetical protein